MNDQTLNKTPLFKSYDATTNLFWNILVLDVTKENKINSQIFIHPQSFIPNPSIFSLKWKLEFDTEDEPLVQFHFPHRKPRLTKFCPMANAMQYFWCQS